VTSTGMEETDEKSCAKISRRYGTRRGGMGVEGEID